MFKSQPDFRIRVTGAPSTLSIEETRSRLKDIFETRKDSLGEKYELRVVWATAPEIYMAFIIYESFKVNEEAVKLFNNMDFLGKNKKLLRFPNCSYLQASKFKV